MLHSSELEIIRFIQQFRTSWLDQFFKFMNFFDTPEFFFILIPLVWVGQGRKTGLRLFYILLLSGLINHALKEFFLSPRPFRLDPDVAVISINGFGFPSGAGQTVILLSGLLLSYWKSPWSVVIAVPYILLVSFSRIYLGVHFPSDILGGWVAGFGLWALYFYIRPPIERFIEGLKPFSLLLLSQAVLLSILIRQQSHFALRLCSMATGVGFGVFIVHSFRLFLPTPKNVGEFALRALVGLSGMWACHALINLFPASHSALLFLQFLLLGLWIGFGIDLTCRKLFPIAMHPER